MHVRCLNPKAFGQVPEASALDQLLRDVERCAVLFRKRQVRDGRRPLEDDEPEAQEADDFVELVTPRALAASRRVSKSLPVNSYHIQCL